MAEYRPYRISNRAAQARLKRIKLIAVTSFLVLGLLINWRVTQYAAWLLGYSRLLGRPLFGRVYAPWAWLVWWARWYGAAQLEPVWELCSRKAGYPLLIIGGLAAGAIVIARYVLASEAPDLHGTARWADDAEVRASGLLAPRRYLPRWLRRPVVRIGLLAPLKPRDGIYLGAWRAHGRLNYLRDCGPGHVLVEAPTRAGKGVNTMVPTLLAWPHSALIHDFKGELWGLTAGARKRMGQLCFKFDPTDPGNPGVKYNPLAEVRLRTPYETADVQNIVQILVDPDGRGFEHDNHWMQAGMALLTGAILHILYIESAKTLRGLIGLLSDPEATIEETIKGIMTAEHDPGGTMGWITGRGEPTHTHPVVAESMREVLNKAEKERSAVISEVVRRLPVFRDPLIAAATEYSELRIDDLVNHERPASLYLSVPNDSRGRLKPLMRLMVNQIIGRMTARLAYKDGRAVAPHRRPLLLMLDEFALLGHFEVFAEALSHIAGFGLRACLAVQSFTQLYDLYGRHESITSNCDSVVRFTPNKLETAEEISRMVGLASVRHAHRTQTDRGASRSEPEVARPLMTPDEVLRMSMEEVLIFTRGRRPIRAPMLAYHQQPYFEQLATIPPPERSDLTHTATAPPPASREKPEDENRKPAGPLSAKPETAASTGQPAGFLNFALAGKAPKR